MSENQTLNDVAPQGPASTRRSTSVAKIAVALVKMQGEAEDPTKNKQADAGKKGKYRYADLPTVLEAVRPILAKNGLAVVQFPCEMGTEPALTTILVHTSGEWMETTMRLRAGDGSPQSVGSALTYARRYAILAICAVAADDDDDGAAASHRVSIPQKPLAEECLEAINGAQSRERLMEIYCQFLNDAKMNTFTPTEKARLDLAFADMGKKFPKQIAQ